MRETLPAIFALIIAAIGWYYLFYSRAAQRLEGVEHQRENRLRGILRRTNAVIMLLMAVGIAVASYHFDVRRQPAEAGMIWLAVLLLLLAAVVLAMIDVRLTIKLRRTLRDRNRP